jgi:hypothetical protein
MQKQSPLFCGRNHRIMTIIIMPLASLYLTTDPQTKKILRTRYLKNAQKPFQDPPYYWFFTQTYYMFFMAI